MPYTYIFDATDHSKKLTEDEERIVIEGAKQGLSKRQIGALLKSSYSSLMQNKNFRILYNEVFSEKIRRITAKAYELAEAGSEPMIKFILEKKGDWGKDKDDIIPADFYSYAYPQKCEVLDRLLADSFISFETYHAICKSLNERYRYITVEETIENLKTLTHQLEEQKKDEITSNRTRQSVTA